MGRILVLVTLLIAGCHDIKLGSRVKPSAGFYEHCYGYTTDIRIGAFVPDRCFVESLKCNTGYIIACYQLELVND